MKALFSENDSYLVETSEELQLFNVYVDESALLTDPVFDAALQSLVGEIFSTNPKPFYAFIQTYGTHYVASTVQGSSITLYNFVQKNFQSYNATTGATSTGSSSVTNNTQTNFVTKDTAVQLAVFQFSQTVNSKTDFASLKKFQNTNTVTSSVWRLDGGNTNLVNLFDASDPAEKISTWKRSVPLNPVTVRVRLREIDALAVNFPDLQTQLHAAVQAVLNSPDDTDILTLGSTELD